MHLFKKTSGKRCFREHSGYTSIRAGTFRYLTVEAADGGEVNISVITDHFTWYAQVLVTSSQTSKCTAQALWDKLIVYYSLPKSTVSDQG